MSGLNGQTYGASKRYTDEHGGGGEPASYLKSIVKDELNKIIKITDKNGVETSFEYGDENIPFISLERLGEYTYRLTFDNLPEYVEGNDSVFTGGCTTFVRDGKTYRSFDLTYDKKATFLIKTKDFDGIAYIQSVNDGNLDEKKKELGQLPYHLADGCNRDGIVVSEHVLFNDQNFQGTGVKENDMTKLPTVILQNIHSMASVNTNPVVNAFLSNMKVPEVLSSKGYTLHFLITDGTTTYTLCPKDDGSAYEFIDITVLPKLANFKWLNKATLERNDADLQERPTGIERWNLIDGETELKDLRFTKAYEEATRLSEFIGEGSTTKDSTDEELMPYYTEAHTAYESRTREDEEPTWQSVHAVVYGPQGIEHLWIQENYEKDYIDRADLSNYYTKEEVDDIVENKIDKTDIANNLTTTEYGKVLDARQGKAINDKLSSQASSNNPVLSESEIDEKISLVEAKQLYKTNIQGSFETKAELTSATTFYNADGTQATPTKNDVAYVLADESKDNACTKYVIASTSETTITWGFVIKISNSPFTQAQLDAINSGATQEKITKINDIDNRVPFDNTVSQIAQTRKYYTDLMPTGLTKKIWGYVAFGTTESPVGTNVYGTLEVLARGNGYFYLIFFRYSSNEVYICFTNDTGTTFTDWKQIAGVDDIDTKLLLKQNITDDTLLTQSKVIPTAINEVYSKKTEIKQISADITEALNSNFLYNITKPNVAIIFTDAETGKQYKQVEYIATQETGTTGSVGQYIETGVYFDEVDNRIGTEIRAKIMATELPGSGANKSIMGLLINTSTTAHALSLWIGNGGGSTYFGKTVNLHNNKLNVEQIINWNADGVVAIYGDGTSETQTAGTGTIRNGPFTKPLHIMWTGASNQSRFAGRFYYLQFYKYGILQQNYIPVIDIDTNEYGLFETVSQKFYANDGTGAFTGGNIVTADNGLYMVENNMLIKLVKENTITTNLSSIAGYDATKVQTLKNTNGAMSWVDEV